MSWTRALPLDELPAGRSKVIELDDEDVLLCRLDDGAVHAVENCCSHDDGPLGEGTLTGPRVQCPRHGAVFDVRSGQVLRMPAAAPIETFATRITDDGWVEIDVEDV